MMTSDETDETHLQIARQQLVSKSQQAAAYPPLV